MPTWWRTAVVALLVTVAAVAAPLSVLATWSSEQLSDTDRHLETVAPLASDPDVQEAVAARVEQVVLARLDVDAAVERLTAALTARDLPPEAAETLRALAGPLADGVRRFIRERIDAVVGSEAFETAWTEANRAAHRGLVAALTGDGRGAVRVDGGTVSIDLATVVETVRARLLEDGFEIAERIPSTEASFEIVHSDDLARVRELFDVLDALSTWLPVIGLAALLAAVAVARNRRRTVLAAALAVAASMLLLAVALVVVRALYLDALPAGSSEAAAGAIFDQLVSFLRISLRVVLAVAVAVALVTLLTPVLRRRGGITPHG